MSDRPVITARAAGLVGCRRCARAWPIDTPRCPACGAPLVSRDPKSLQHVWAWWVAGVMAYIPANLYPMLETRTLVDTTSETIMGGVIALAKYGSWGIAAVIFIASVAIPVAKFAAIAYLAWAVQRKSSRHHHSDQLLFEIIEYIGRWSMIDVFVVAILSALVALGSLVEIRPGPASLTFALSVLFTMLSAQSFDSRLIWDRIGK